MPAGPANRAAKLFPTSSVRPQASANGATIRAPIWTARKVEALKPRWKPSACAVSAIVIPAAASTQAAMCSRGSLTSRRTSIPVMTAATSAAAAAARKEIDIPLYGA